MTRVKFVKKNHCFYSIECDGHTLYGVVGEDIVCAALSSIVQTAALGILQVAGVNAKMLIKEQEGYFKLTLPDTMSKTEAHDVDIIFKTLYLGVADLHSGYSDFIELEVKE